MAEVVLGPLLPEEANVLTAIVRMVVAETVVEFGYLYGDSSKALLAGMEATGKLYSFDINPGPSLPDDRLTVLQKDMQDFKHEDVDSRVIDFVFFDASHNLGHNIVAFDAVKPHLHENHLIAIHDTGYWNTAIFNHQSFGFEHEGRRFHQPDEIEFVKYLTEQGYMSLDLCTMRELRHGLSILQR